MCPFARDDPLSTPRSRFPSLVGEHFIWVASSLKRSSNPRRRGEYIYIYIKRKRGKKKKNNESIRSLSEGELKNVTILRMRFSYPLSTARNENIVEKFYRESRYANDHGISMKLLIKLLTFSSMI